MVQDGSSSSHSWDAAATKFPCEAAQYVQCPRDINRVSRNTHNTRRQWKRTAGSASQPVSAKRKAETDWGTERDDHCFCCYTRAKGAVVKVCPMTVSAKVPYCGVLQSITIILFASRIPTVPQSGQRRRCGCGGVPGEGGHGPWSSLWRSLPGIYFLHFYIAAESCLLIC